MRKNIFPFIATAVFFTACNNASQVTELQKTVDSLKTVLAEDHSADAAVLEKLDSAWSAVSEQKSAEGWLSYYSADAIMMPPGEKVCADAASREASIKNMFATPGISLKFQPAKSEV